MADTVILLLIVAGVAVFRHDLFVVATAGSRASGLINKTASTFVRDTLLIDINNTVPYTGRIVSWNVCCRGLKTPLEDGTYELVYAIYRENSSVSDMYRRYERVSDIFHTNLGEGESEEGETESTMDEGFHCYSYVYNETTDNDSLAFLIQSGDIIGACSCVRRNPNGTCTMMDEQRRYQPMITVVLNGRDHSLLHNMTIDAFNCGTETGDALFPSVIPSSDNNNNITTENGKHMQYVFKLLLID